MAAPLPIAAAREGQIVRLAGTVRPLQGCAPLTSPLAREPCVYFEVRGGAFEQDTEHRGAQDFYLEDESGDRALVVMEHGRVDAQARLRGEAFTALDADINDVAARLHRLKQTARHGSAREQREARPRLQRLRELATLLCAIRAHARDRIHGGVGSLAEQAELIRRGSARFAGAKDVTWVRSLQLQSERQEVLLRAGDRVEVSGVCRWEPDPDPSAATDYRRTTLRLVLRGEVRVTGAGELAPSRGKADSHRLPGPPGHRRRRRRRWPWYAAAAGAALLYWLLQRLL